jgi:hypothetical protein
MLRIVTASFCVLSIRRSKLTAAERLQCSRVRVKLALGEDAETAAACDERIKLCGDFGLSFLVNREVSSV